MNPSRLFREVLESHEFRLSDTVRSMNVNDTDMMLSICLYVR